MTPLRTGIALAITSGLFYTLCTLVWVVAPGPFLSFMSNLFHGMDFTSMVQPQPLAWSGFLAALLVLSTWVLLAGAFFAWILNCLTRCLPSTSGDAIEP